MSPSWKRDPDTGEWIMVDRPIPPAVKREPVNQHRWAPGPNAGWQRAGESHCRTSFAKRLLWLLVIAIPAVVAVVIKGFDYGR